MRCTVLRAIEQSWFGTSTFHLFLDRPLEAVELFDAREAARQAFSTIIGVWRPRREHFRAAVDVRGIFEYVEHFRRQEDSERCSFESSILLSAKSPRRTALLHNLCIDGALGALYFLFGPCSQHSLST